MNPLAQTFLTAILGAILVAPPALATPRPTGRTSHVCQFVDRSHGHSRPNRRYNGAPRDLYGRRPPLQRRYVPPPPPWGYMAPPRHYYQDHHYRSPRYYAPPRHFDRFRDRDRFHHDDHHRR